MDNLRIRLMTPDDPQFDGILCDLTGSDVYIKGLYLPFLEASVDLDCYTEDGVCMYDVGGDSGDSTYVHKYLLISYIRKRLQPNQYDTDTIYAISYLTVYPKYYNTSRDFMANGKEMLRINVPSIIYNSIYSIVSGSLTNWGTVQDAPSETQAYLYIPVSCFLKFNKKGDSSVQFTKYKIRNCSANNVYYVPA